MLHNFCSYIIVAVVECELTEVCALVGRSVVNNRRVNHHFGIRLELFNAAVFLIVNFLFKKQKHTKIVKQQFTTIIKHYFTVVEYISRTSSLKNTIYLASRYSGVTANQIYIDNSLCNASNPI